LFAAVIVVCPSRTNSTVGSCHAASEGFTSISSHSHVCPETALRVLD